MRRRLELAGSRRSDTLVPPYRFAGAGIGRQSPLRYTWASRKARRKSLELAGSRRSDTLGRHTRRDANCWNWPAVAAQIHFLRAACVGVRWNWPAVAAQIHCLRRSPFGTSGIGRQSPLRYTGTDEASFERALELAGSRRSDTLLSENGLGPRMAGIGRQSPLRYTLARCSQLAVALELAGSRRSDTLSGVQVPGICQAGIGRQSPLRYTRRWKKDRCPCWDWPAVAAQIHSSPHRPRPDLLGLAGSRRSDTLTVPRTLCRSSWDWPAVAAQIHSKPDILVPDGLELVGSRRSDTLSASGCKHLYSWNWSAVAAQIHYDALAMVSLAAGIGRQSPLRYTYAPQSPRLGPLELVGSRRSDTLIALCGRRPYGLELVGSRRSDTLDLRVHRR